MRAGQLTVLTAIAFVVLGCDSARQNQTERGSQPVRQVSIEEMEVVDLSHSYDEQTIYWPTSPSTFAIESLHHGPTESGFFYAANSICTPEHGGTHLDAPIHFGEGKWTTEEIPLERLVGRGIVIDVSSKSAEDADYRLQFDDVKAWEAEHGSVPDGAIVLLRTGWSERWPDRLRYLGDDTPGDASNLHFPSYGEEAARYLIDERNVAVLGVDTASIDYGPSTDFLVHQVASAANVPGLENLTNLHRLPAKGFSVVALPMKIAGGSGGPLRAIALLEEAHN